VSTGKELTHVENILSVSFSFKTLRVSASKDGGVILRKNIGIFERYTVEDNIQEMKCCEIIYFVASVTVVLIIETSGYQRNDSK
jgi:hypothetical protein